MEGERKKRKMETEEEDEEEKIEKFFALVRSTREVRELLRGNLNGAKEKKDQKKAEKEEQKTAGVWNPAFQPEDFIEDHKSAVHHGAGPSKAEDEDKAEDKGSNGLNLNLSL